MAGRKGSLLERFERMYTPEPMSGCWLWLGAPTNEMGYGQINDGNRLQKAHRVSWILHCGEIPDGLWVLHKCDNPACVNPQHLFLGDLQANVDDMHKKGRAPVGERQPNAILSDAAVREIRSDERGPRALAKVYGVSHQKISQIKLRQRWRHVT